MSINRSIVKLLRFFIRCELKKNKKKRPEREVHSVHVFYRICDAGYPKQKPSYITKENCLKNAIKAFPVEKVHWHVIADNVCEETYQMILNYLSEEYVKRVSVGHGAGTFRMVFDMAEKLNDNDLVYFLEDDYLHMPDALSCLLEAAYSNVEDYITLYDHPDKYLCFKGGDSSLFLKRKLYFTVNHHWRTTSSTTMTFAAFVDVIKRDHDVFMRWTQTRHPFDFEIFIELGFLKKARLISPIPSLSTHGETEFLAPCIDWEHVANCE